MSFMIKNALYCFVSKLVSSLSGAKGGREEGFVKCNKSCLYVCCKKNKKRLKKKKTLVTDIQFVRNLYF